MSRHAPSLDAIFSLQKKIHLNTIRIELPWRLQTTVYPFQHPYILFSILYVKTNESPIEVIETVITTAPEIVIICSQINIDYLQQEMVADSIEQNFTIFSPSTQKPRH